MKKEVYGYKSRINNGFCQMISIPNTSILARLLEDTETPLICLRIKMKIGNRDVKKP